MKLKQLKENIDNLFRYYSDLSYDPENLDVVITLSERSVGARAYSNIESINVGFDWESGQLRIRPSKELVSKGNSLQDVVEPYVYEYIVGDKKRKVCHCSTCGCQVGKKDKFCKSCGQKLKK